MITDALYALAANAVEKTAEAYRVARGVIRPLSGHDFAVRGDALTSFLRYGVLHAEGDTKAAGEMKAGVIAACAVLASDFGSVDTPGLANLVHMEYDVRIAERQRSLQDGAPRDSVAEAVEKLSREQQRADRALAEAAQSLAALCAALQEERTC